MILMAMSMLGPRLALADLLKAGDSAPNFSTQAIVGDQTENISLAGLHDRTVVLYFYPKDFTPGCTKEACAFRDGYAKLRRAGIVVLGCSIDTAASHRNFIKEYNLPFPLLIDPGKKIADAYGVKNGILSLGLDSRVTYVIKDGKIIEVYPKVDPALNAGQIISDLGVDKATTANN
jgi:peroxiredoxin Q/BCP